MSVRYEIGDTIELLRALPDQSIHLVITSPPYWNAKDYCGAAGQIGFSQTYPDYIKSLLAVWIECARVLVPNGKACINVQPLPVSPGGNGSGRSKIINIMSDIDVTVRDAGLELSNMIIWDKRSYVNFKMFGSYPYPPNFLHNVSYEFIHVYRKPGNSRTVPEEVKISSRLTQSEWRDWCLNPFWDIPPVMKIATDGSAEILGHDAPFPVEIPRRLIKLFSFKGDIVLDPFLGSGTTLAACKLEGRDGVGFELNKSYAPLIDAFMRDPRHVPTYDGAKKLRGATRLDDFF